jgi:predicted TIM-barrel fold metal-dependent hydrolase
VSSEPAPFAGVAPLVRELARKYGDRLLWGTDWPCVNFEGVCHEPADLLDAVHRWLPEDGDRRRVLVDNPAALYGFVPAGVSSP